MASPSVSVVIATYNRGARIARTLDSIFAQTTPVTEVIVSDDQSTDDTAAWIRAHYPSVRVITFPNGGTSVARNRGAAATSGDVLVFIDHDDELLPQAIETLTGMLARFPAARAAFADHTYREDANQTFLKNHHSLNPSFHRLRAIPTIDVRGSEKVYGKALHYALLHGNLLQQPWAIYRSAFLKLGGFDAEVRYCEDWELYLRLTERFVVVLGDHVIGNHYVEGANLHRAAGQEVQHMKVLRKQLQRHGWYDPRAHLLLRERLSGYHKAAGDRFRAKGLPEAWWEYVRAFAYWPFDVVTALRVLTWLPHRSRGRRDTASHPPDHERSDPQT